MPTITVKYSLSCLTNSKGVLRSEMLVKSRMSENKIVTGLRVPPRLFSYSSLCRKISAATGPETYFSKVRRTRIFSIRSSASCREMPNPPLPATVQIGAATSKISPPCANMAPAMAK